MGKYIVSRESRDLEQNLAAMLARVEHRQQQGLTSDADHNMNKMLYNGLRTATALTHDFTQACDRGNSPRYCARKLSDMAQSMPIIVKMIENMQGEKHLSPLFDRQMEREYRELYDLAYQIRDAVHADGDKLRSSVPPPPAAGQPQPSTEPLNPVALTCVLVAMPVIVTLGVMMGIAQGIKDVRAKRHEPEPPEQPGQAKRHLTLVHSVK